MKLSNSLLGLFKSLNSALENVKFEQVVDVDGKEFNLSGREKGAEATVDGEPLADGTYTLTDNFSFTVKDGLIDSIEEEVEKVEETETVVETAEESEPEAPAVNEEMDALKAEVESLKTELESIKESIQALSTKEDVQAFTSEVKLLSDNIKSLALIPLEQSKTSQSFKAQSKKENDLAILGQIFNSKK